MEFSTDMMYEELGISKEVIKFGTEIEKNLKERFEKIDLVAEYNQMKVIKAMQKNKLSDVHFGATTGYGYNDLGPGTVPASPAAVPASPSTVPVSLVEVPASLAAVVPA